ncbi:MAG TPA: reverse transcriptase family protein [Nitrososphaeraceae archaeon]|nr:reverse transcriptase family protein [Nitrososphaeraceae archaeon]
MSLAHSPLDYNSLRLFYTNIRSFKPKLDYLSFLVDLKEYDIFLFTETWLDSKFDDACLSKHREFEFFRVDNGAGGICALVNKKFCPTLTDAVTYKTSGLTFLILDLLLPNSLRIIAVYFSPKSTKSFDNVRKLCDTLGTYINSHCIIVGDFNMPEINWFTRSNTDSRSIMLLDLGKNCSLNQIINSPTRGSNILDLIFLPNSFTKYSLNISAPIPRCDHNSINLMIDLPSPRNLSHYNNQCISSTYNFSKADWHSLNIYFSNINWKTIFNCNDIDLIYSRFIAIIHQGLSLHIPEENCANHSQKIPIYLKRLADYRNLLWNNCHYPKVRKKFINVSASLTKKLNKFYGNIERKAIKKRSLYSYVRKITKPNFVPPCIIHNTERHYTPKAKCEIFAHHFHNIFNMQDKSATLDIIDNDIKFDHNLIFISNYSVFEMLKKLPAKVNTAPDHLPSIVLKECALSLALPIATILRKSFYLGKLPCQWKQSIVIPLHKNGSKNLANNYRPISLTCTISKLAESCIYEEMLGFIESRSIIPSIQHGFRKKHSVINSLLESTDDWSNAIDKKNCIDCFYLDFKKAFDSVSHTRLLTKLENYGFTGLCLQWIKNFLEGRTFVVKINNELSTPRPMSKGVPQGSILGPFLFNLYVADIVEKFNDDAVIKKMFADDLKAYIEFDSLNIQSKHQSLCNFLSHISNWSIDNDLPISIEKSRIFYIGTQNPKLKYCINNIDIPVADYHIRDLGLLITSDLNWKTHIKTKCNSAIRKWYMFMRALKSTNPNLLITLYKTYIRPIIEFGSEIFNNYNNSTMLLIETVQKKITRHIFYRCNISDQIPCYNDRLKYLNLEPLKIRRNRTDLRTYQKILSGKLIINPKNAPITSQGCTRSHNTPKIPCVRTKCRQNNFFIRLNKLYRNFNKCKTSNDILTLLDNPNDFTPKHII